MPRAVAASCQAGIVTVDGSPVQGAIILSEGVGASTGTAFFDKDKVYYVANTTPDLKTILQKLTGVLTQLTTALTAIDVKPVGGTGSAPAPGAAANIANITSANAELTTLLGQLK